MSIISENGVKFVKNHKVNNRSFVCELLGTVTAIGMFAAFAALCIAASGYSWN